jgi:hypothetical protein
MQDWTDLTLPAIADAWALSVFSPDVPHLQVAPGEQDLPLQPPSRATCQRLPIAGARRAITYPTKMQNG